MYVTTEKKQLAGFFYIYFCTNVSAYYAEPQATQSDGLDFAYTVKKVRCFPSPAGMSLTKLSLDGNNLIFPGQGHFG